MLPRHLPIALFVTLAAGCGSATPTNPSHDDDAGTPSAPPTTGTGGGGSGGDATASTGQGAAGGTVDPGPADVTASLLYINQRVFREDDAFARGGIARLELHTPQDLPADDRPEFFNADGERCTLESGTEWPTLLDGGQTWPMGPFLDAGNLTLTANTAPGPVVYEYYDSYYLRLSPGPVKLGNFTHNFFFSPEYIPHGVTATVEASGGADLGGFSLSDVELAKDYVVTSPNLEEGGDVIDTTSLLSVAWGPPAPGDQMAVIVKGSFSFIKCVFDDDGHATVPAEAMSQLVGGQFATFTVQTWREHGDTVRVTSDDGEQIDVVVTSRHVQLGRFATK